MVRCLQAVGLVVRQLKEECVSGRRCREFELPLRLDMIKDLHGIDSPTFRAWTCLIRSFVSIQLKVRLEYITGTKSLRYVVRLDCVVSLNKTTSTFLYRKFVDENEPNKSLQMCCKLYDYVSLFPISSNSFL